MQSPIPPQGQHLRLAPHVRACHSDGQVILLDLQRNKYVGVGGRHLTALAAAVEGWPRSPVEQDVPDAPVDVDVLTRQLRSQGLLTDQAAEQLPNGFIEEATVSLDTEDASRSATIGARRLSHFLQSAAGAAMWLRFRSLLWIAHAVADRRARLEGRGSRPAPLDAMRNAVAAYEKLRPLVFSAHDRCLQDSLALVGFLAHEGIFPRWVIGVKTRPFGAHSWVQSGAIVLNDQHDHVRRFHPILIV